MPHPNGRSGETLAADYLIASGYQIVARNIYTRAGEIDLVVRRGRTVRFVEVKTRRTSCYGEGVDAVDTHKQRRIRRAAERYLMTDAGDWDDIGFAVIVIDLRQWALWLIDDAFEGMSDG